MFSVWKEDMSGSVAYVGKNGISEVKVKGAFVKLVYLFLQEMNGNPSYNDIAEATELSRSIVIRCVKVLEEKGLLDKKVRPTKALHNKSNVYTIHQRKEQSSVRDTPKSLKTLKPSISIDFITQNLPRIKRDWYLCFHEDMTVATFITLAKQSSVETIANQIRLVHENHYCPSAIDDPGKYMYKLIKNGGYVVDDNPVKRDTKKKSSTNNKKSTLTKACAGEIKTPTYCPEELAAKKKRIEEKLRKLHENGKNRNVI